MRTIITLLFIILSLHSVAQETTSKVPDKKNEHIEHVPAAKLQLILVDESSYTTHGVARSCTFVHEKVDNLPSDDFRDIVSLLPGVYQSRRGDELRFFGARESGTLYIIDGIQVQRK